MTPTAFALRRTAVIFIRGSDPGASLAGGLPGARPAASSASLYVRLALGVQGEASILAGALSDGRRGVHGKPCRGRGRRRDRSPLGVVLVHLQAAYAMNPQPKPTKRPKAPRKPMARSKPMKRTWMKKRPPRRLERESESEKAYKQWIHGQACVMAGLLAHPCDGEIQMSHERDRTGAGRLESPLRSVPMCRHHHLEHWHADSTRGYFAGWQPETRKEWMRGEIAKANERFHASSAALGEGET